MKVKYADQVARVVVGNPESATGVAYVSLEDSFPTLEAGDAILIKKVNFTLDFSSMDVVVEAAGV